MPWSIANTTPQFGNLGKNTMTGPDTNNWDISLYRRLRFTERINGQLRFETYNTFNHTQFGNINTSMQFRNSDGAQINSAFLLPTSARPPRRIQLSMRISF